MGWPFPDQGMWYYFPSWLHENFYRKEQELTIWRRFMGLYCWNCCQILPFSLLKHYIQVGEHLPDSFLFRKISHTKASFKLRKQKLSYSRAPELFKKQLKQIHLDPSLYDFIHVQEGPASQLLLGYWTAWLWDIGMMIRRLQEQIYHLVVCR